MAIDQSSVPKDLHSLNLNRAVMDDPPNAEGFCPSRLFRTVYYPVVALDAGIRMLAFGNTSSVAAWASPPFTAANRLATKSEGGDEGGVEDWHSRKVKFLCSFGDKLLPRPRYGVLQYVGRQTQIINVRQDVGFQELLQKMVEMGWVVRWFESMEKEWPSPML